MTEVNIQPNVEIERNWAMLAHLLGLLPIPFLAVIGPLLVWLIKKGDSAYIETNAKESANFQITVLLVLIVSVWLCFLFVGIFLIIGIVTANFVLVLMAAFKAKKGKSFHYPFALRFF